MRYLNICKLVALFVPIILCAVHNVYAAQTAIRIPAPVRPSQIDMESSKRVTATLEKLGKNLILERTRGEKNIAVFQTAAPAVVLVMVGKDSIGSGAIINRYGVVITNWHVVRRNPSAVVVLKPRDSVDLRKDLAFSALVTKIDQVADLALLKIVNPPHALPHLSIGAATPLSVGQDVHAIGHPQGEVWTYTRGIVSQIRTNYEWKTEEGIIHRANVVQTQTPINPGNSGGPLLDDDGRLIGINSFRRATGEGLNYAVSLDTINEFVSREGDREVAQSSSSGNRELKCTEGYDTMRRGWKDIVGCYQDAKVPPPDIWVVFHTRDKAPTYIAMDSDTSGTAAKIDLIRKNLLKGNKLSEFYVDLDCDGKVDVIETHVGDNKVSSRLPSPNLRMISLAKELDTALKNGRIPYPTMRVCQ